MSASPWRNACMKAMSAIRLILQARMSSSRLPGKMLMPIGDIPLVVLCAKRVMRSDKFHDVVVATSEEPSDDPMVPILKSNGVKVVRGPLDDVLARYILAAEGLNDKDLIVRMTGDNPVVDSDFIDLIIADHKKSGARYTRSLSPFDRLPYGISAEVIEAGLLRELNNTNASAYDREHVTIHFTLKNEYHLFQSPLDRDLSHLRMTVDTQDDYDRIVNLFEGEDIINVTWNSLAQKLNKQTNAFRTPYKRNGLKSQSVFALGTAQLGLNYGIANKNGQPDNAEAKAILDTAIDHGVTFIDTAAAYGESEKTIGTLLTLAKKQDVVITTKLAPDADTKEKSISSIEKSLKNLGISSLNYLLLHRWEQRKTSAWGGLTELRAQGKIDALGVSIQSPQEGLESLNDPSIKFIQLPFNICDGRWESFIEHRKVRADVHIQARSSLLQGLLTLPPHQWPLDRLQAEIISKKLHAMAAKYNRKSVIDLCYAYVRSQDWIDSIVVGVETELQLRENLSLFSEPLLTDYTNDIAITDDNFLNPALWPKGTK